MQPSRHAAPTDRPSLRLLHGARRRRRTQGACSSLPLALEWESACFVNQAPAADGVCLLCNQAAMQLRLIDKRRRRRTQDVCSSLPLALEWESALWHSDQAPAAEGVCLLCNQAAMQLRLTDQACSCSTVRGGGGGLKVRARLCLWHLSGECSPPRPGTCISKCLLALQLKPP